MKASSCLDLIVRPAAGIDLFPGESSGYNSSASSVTGDQSPCWGDQSSKRLSIVREEFGIIDTGTAAANIIAASGQMRPKFWQRKELDVRKDRLLMVEPPIISESFQNPAPVQHPQQLHHQPRKHSLRNEANTTIIKLYESETVINNTIVPAASAGATTTNLIVGISSLSDAYHSRNNLGHISRPLTVAAEPPQNAYGTHSSPHNCKPIVTNSDSNFVRNNNTADICLVSRKIETKTVTVEVHHGGASVDDGDHVSGDIQRPPVPPPMSFASAPSSSAAATLLNSSGDKSDLSSAISQELKKRAEVIYNIGGARIHYFL